MEESGDVFSWWQSIKNMLNDISNMSSMNLITFFLVALCLPFLLSEPFLSGKLYDMTVRDLLWFIVVVCSVILLSRFGYAFFASVKLWRKAVKERKIREGLRLKAEEETRIHNEDLKSKLLSLPSRAASILIDIYMQPSHSAWIPIIDPDAPILKGNGLANHRDNPKVRGHGYSYECKCYRYRLTEEVVEYLNQHMQDLGENWGMENFPLDLSKYQRAGKVVPLEAGMHGINSTYMQ